MPLVRSLPGAAGYSWEVRRGASSAVSCAAREPHVHTVVMALCRSCSSSAVASRLQNTLPSLLVQLPEVLNRGQALLGIGCQLAAVGHGARQLSPCGGLWREMAWCLRTGHRDGMGHCNILRGPEL